jgi:hypothetical protein
MIHAIVLAAAAASAGAPVMHRPPPPQGETMMDVLGPDEMQRRAPAPPPPRRDRVRKALAKQRAKHLAALRAYRRRGVFAHDLDRSGEVYVWKDADGHLDAVAAIMASDGKDAAAIVDAIAPQWVGVHIVDVTYGDVYQWMLVSGFTAEEIDRIQRPHTRPTVVRTGDDNWRTDEDARLSKSYGAVDSYLREHTDDGLDAATDILMAQGSELAWNLVDPKHHPRGGGGDTRPAIPEPRRPRAPRRR